MYSNILWKFRTQKNFDQKEKRKKKHARKEEPQMISKTTDTRITRNKHQLQHQHNKAVEKENPSLWPLKESDYFSEIQNELSSSHVYQKTTSYHNQIDWRKWWGLRNDDDTDPLLSTTLSFPPLYECKKKERKPLTNNSATIDIRIIQINTSITTNYLSKQPQALLHAHASFPKGSAIS